jgi:ERF superfamily
MDQSQSPEIDKLAAAIVAAQLQLLPAKKDSINPFFHSKYADLANVWEALAPFRMEGIAITQAPADSPDGYIALETQLTHSSGQWMRGHLKLRVAKDDPQGAGSAITYARRYMLGCMTGLVTEADDDGNSASTAPSVAQTKAQPVKKPVAQPITSTAPGKAWIVPFGKSKGQPVSDISDEDVDYLLRYYNGKLNDPANASSRYRDEWEQAILEVRAELLARYPDSVGV